MRDAARYVGRRAAQGLSVLFFVSLCSFVLSELVPGDFYSEARLNPQVSREALVALRFEHGLDRPLTSKYCYWLKSVVRGDWGYSLSYNMPVGLLLRSRLLNTLLLTVTAGVLAWLVAVPAGIWLATTGHAGKRLLGRGAVALLMALPELAIVLALQVIALRSGRLPVGGMLAMASFQMSFLGRALDLGRHLALPVTALLLSALPVLVTHSASAISDVMETPFIRGARANGIPRLRLLCRHALPAAAHPLIALFGLSVGTLLSASVLVENAIGWPGLGRLMLEATLQRDVDVVIGIVTLSGAFLIAGSFLADLLLYAVDPRIRRE